MHRPWNWRSLAFWTMCGWCGWVMSVRGQSPESPNITFETMPKSPLEGGPSAVASPIEIQQTGMAATGMQRPPTAWMCDPLTGARLQGSLDTAWTSANEQSARADLPTAYRCVQILRFSSIETDRRIALLRLEQCPWWPQVRGALTAVRTVAVADYSVEMRAIAMRMLARGDLPERVVWPTLAMVARFDGSPELRATAQAHLAPTARNVIP